MKILCKYCENLMPCDLYCKALEIFKTPETILRYIECTEFIYRQEEQNERISDESRRPEHV